jgi:GNAT superfamily N-acetyltransferase
LAGTKARSALRKIRVERFYVLDSAPEPIPARIPVDFHTVQHFDENLADRLSRLTGKCANWQGRIQLGHHCILAVHEDELIGSIWICPAGWFISKERPLGLLAPDVGFVYDAFVAAHLRGQRIGSARLVYLYHQMKEKGLKRNCITVEDGNKPSIRSVLQVGYRPTNSVVRLHRWMMIHQWVDGGPPNEVLPHNEKAPLFPFC